MNEQSENDVFISQFSQEFLEFSKENSEGISQKNIAFYFENQVKKCDTIENQSKLLNFGIALLKKFIQINWTGPEAIMDKKLLSLLNLNAKLNVLNELIVDAENVISVVEVPELLFYSKMIFENVWSHLKNFKAAKIWCLRSFFIHQQILEELSPSLFDKICLIIDEIESALDSVSKSSAVAYHLEFARIFLYYNNIQRAKANIICATELLGLKISLSGALGKRTKYQKEDLAQLILKLSICEDEVTESNSEEIMCSTIPKDLKLNDDVRLDKIKYSDSLANKHPNLSGLQEGVIISNLFQALKSQPKDDLADEELTTLISCILEQPKAWSFKMSALLLRSKLEANHKRTVERSMMQVQILVDSIKDTEPSFEDKFKHFFISYLPPKWEIQSILANILASMGSIKSALEVFKNLKDWENVIYCYSALQMRHKAQEIIEQELKKNPTPKLWCLLGDATDNVACYEKAWELSNRRSARAQRHWALFYYYRKNYHESIEHFQKSLEMNSLQKELWYRLGYAALAIENWEISALAYRRYCVLDSECFEAWNNLGRCYCEMKQKPRAWKALQEALKVDYSNWKVWDNYMVVSSDLKQFDEVLRSYHEILNLKEKHLDIPILNSLLQGLKNSMENIDFKNSKAESQSQFKSNLLKLFGRLTSQIINDPELWLLYSEVLDSDSPENLSKKYQLLLKAHRSSVNKADWDKNLEACNKVVYILSKLIEVGLLINKPEVLMSCQLAASGLLSKIKKLYSDVDISETLEKNLTKLNAAINSENS